MATNNISDKNTLDVLDVAIICHQANKTLCETIGDTTQLNWEEAPDWQHESVIQGVRLHLANPNIDAAASHVAWLESKIRDGWQYGPEKDPLNKLHPCLVNFDQLPPLQQAKDHLVKGIVDALAPFTSPEE